MRDWKRGIRKRREAKLRALREGRLPKNVYADRSKWERWDKKEFKTWDKKRPFLWRYGKKQIGGLLGKRESRFLWQVFLSFFLLTIIYLIFQSNVPASRQAQDFIGEVMERDFNFASVNAWYRELAGRSILPTFSLEESETKSDREVKWVPVVRGKVLRSFQEDGQGVLIQVEENSPVVSAAEGWVVFVGEREGLGQTVIIRHAKGNEIWYGRLKEPQVREKEWVKPQQPIGMPGGTEGSLYIARKSGEIFIDPQDVIAVE